MLVTILLVTLFGFTVSIEPQQQQFFCIDTSAQVHACANNVRPTEFATADQVAYARYSNRINQTGWAELELVTNVAQSDANQAYYAGFLEGYLTAHLIDSRRRSNDLGINGDSNNKICKNYTKFVQDNLNYPVEKILKSEKHLEDGHYWHEVALTLYQISGIDDGYLMAMNRSYQNKPHLNLNPCGVFLLNINDETDDIDEFDDSGDSVKEKRSTGKCSAIVKWLPEKGDVLVAHNTWGDYSTMLRLLKKYSLNYSTSKAKSVTMTSYPGLVFSDDDFYITSANLVIQETSLDTYNDKLYEGISAHGIVMEFVRNSVANRLASTSMDWSAVFGKHNSGTYNNQFMLVDLKKLVEGKIENGFFTVLEQQPNLIHYEDMSDHLRKHSYWASYNVPYFEKVYEQSGYAHEFKKHGDHYSHKHAPRALIFKRDQGKVTNVSSLLHLMRYNDFKHDPLSRCNCTPPYSAEYAIAARADLNDQKGKYAFKDLAFHATGAIDVKITDLKLARQMQFVALSGPTDQGQPAFDWDQFPDKSVKHYDQPKVWHFKPVVTKWDQNGKDFPNFEFDF